MCLRVAALRAVIGVPFMDAAIDLCRAELDKGTVSFGYISADGAVKVCGTGAPPCHYELKGMPRSALAVWSTSYGISSPATPGYGRGPAQDIDAVRAWYAFLISDRSPWRDLGLAKHNSDPEYIRTHGWIISVNPEALQLLYNFLIAQRLAYEYPASLERWYAWVKAGFDPAFAAVCLTLCIGNEPRWIGGHTPFDRVPADLSAFMKCQPKIDRHGHFTPCNVIWGPYERGDHSAFEAKIAQLPKRMQKIFIPPTAFSGAIYKTVTNIDPDEILNLLRQKQKELLA